MAEVEVRSQHSSSAPVRTDHQRRVSGAAAKRHRFQPPSGLTKEQLDAMLGSCLKLASENKITRDNTWRLELIDHMEDLVKPDKGQHDDSTNFRMASCTLEAGVKIYCYRVDSVHEEAFKILGGLSRTSKANEGAELQDDREPEESRKKRNAREADADPNLTLEPSYEAINVKKFDLAFAVDPLFHKTSAQFDEGGARGLLLHNLSVYNGFEIVFDSREVPDKAFDNVLPAVHDIQVDLGPLHEQLAAAQVMTPDILISSAYAELCQMAGWLVPTDAADAAMQLVAEVAGSSQVDHSAERTGAAGILLTQEFPVGNSATHGLSDTAELGAGSKERDYDSGSDAGFDDMHGYHNDYLADEGRDSIGQEPDSTDQVPRPAASMCNALQVVERLPGGPPLQEEWLAAAGAAASSVGTGLSWAGAAHWRFRPITTSRMLAAAKSKPRARREPKQMGLDFDNLPDLPKDAFAPPAKKSDITLMKVVPVNTLLPEDHHYQITSLNKLFLKPMASLRMAFESNPQAGPAKAPLGVKNQVEDHDDYDGGGGFEDDGGDQLDSWAGGDSTTATEQGGTHLLAAPRKVERISISYSRASKQVDVRALKESLWQCLEDVSSAATSRSPGSAARGISFQDVIACLPEDNMAGRLEDLSVHLCFICMLHLANERGLAITGVPTLDGLHIVNPLDMA